ncbi:MAG: hypothetical protein ACT4PW_14235 [Acidimicrobiia bacterium]
MPGRRPGEGAMGHDELVPCPTCWLPADVVAPPPHDIFCHSRCPRGHDNTLVPAVLAHLRALGAVRPDRCDDVGVGFFLPVAERLAAEAATRPGPDDDTLARGPGDDHRHRRRGRPGVDASRRGASGPGGDGRHR